MSGVDVSAGDPHGILQSTETLRALLFCATVQAPGRSITIEAKTLEACMNGADDVGWLTYLFSEDGSVVLTAEVRGALNG